MSLYKPNDVVLINGNVCIIDHQKAQVYSAIFYSNEHSSFRKYQKVKEWQIVKPTDTPIPEKLAELLATRVKKFKKYDVVSFDLNGKLTKATVLKGGKKPIVITQDMVEYGVAVEYLQHSQFSEEELIAIDPQSKSLQYWTVKKYKEYNDLSEETIAFSADVIHKDFSETLKTCNNGKGEAMRIYGGHHLQQRLRSEVIDDVAQLYPLQDIEKIQRYELEEDFIRWLGFWRKFNVPWSSYLQDYFK